MVAAYDTPILGILHLIIFLASTYDIFSTMRKMFLVPTVHKILNKMGALFLQFTSRNLALQCTLSWLTALHRPHVILPWHFFECPKHWLLNQHSGFVIYGATKYNKYPAYIDLGKLGELNVSITFLVNICIWLNRIWLFRP